METIQRNFGPSTFPYDNHEVCGEQLHTLAKFNHLIFYIMTEEKIEKVEFLNVEDKENRKVVVTLTDDVKVTVWAKNGKYMTGGGSISVDLRCRNIIGAVIGYLLGDEPERMSYGELAAADAAFYYDLAITLPDDGDKADEMLFDFTDRIAHFEDWEA